MTSIATNRILGGVATASVVIALILGALIVYGSMTISHLGDQRRPYTHWMLQGLGKAVTDFQLAEGHYPDEQNWLDQLVSHGYVDHVVVDAWGNSYQYARTEYGFTVRSFGSDGVEGGTGSAADVVEDFSDEVCNDRMLVQQGS